MADGRAVTLGDAVVYFRGDLGDLNSAIGNAEKMVKKTMGNILGSMRQIGQGMTVMGGAIMGGMAVAVKSYVDYGSSIDDMRKKTGLSAETVSALGYAMKLSGASMDSLQPALKGMSKLLESATDEQKRLTEELGPKQKQALEDAQLQYQKLQVAWVKANQELLQLRNSGRFTAVQWQEGALKVRELERQMTALNQQWSKTPATVGTATQTLAALGLKLDDIMRLNPDQRFLRLAEAVAAVKDPTLQVAYATQVFGRSGQDLLPFLAEGPEGMRAMMERARELGLVMDNETAASLDNIGDSIDSLKASIMGLIRPIAEALLPAVQRMIDGLQGWIGRAREWIAAHSDLVAQITVVVAAIGAFSLAFGPVLVALASLIPLIAQFGALLVGLATGPIGITIAAIIGIGVVLYAVFKDKMSVAVEWVRAHWATITDLFWRGWETIEAVGRAIGAVLELAWVVVSAFVRTVWGFVTAFLEGLGIDVNASLAQWMGWLNGWFRDAQVSIDAFTLGVRQFTVSVKAYMQELVDFYNRWVAPIFNALGAVVGWLGKASSYPYRATAGLMGFASGGTAPGGLALVGEQGPELVTLPQGAYVHTAAKTRTILGASGLAGVSAQIMQILAAAGSHWLQVLNELWAKHRISLDTYISLMQLMQRGGIGSFAAGGWVGGYGANAMALAMPNRQYYNGPLGGAVVNVYGLTVREEADVDRIAESLDRKIRATIRSGGKRTVVL